MNPKTTDLNEPASPDHIPAVLRLAAQKMREQNAELQSAWQDGSINSWDIIAKELERAADRISRKLHL